jgi:hypothetical protein
VARSLLTIQALDTLEKVSAESVKANIFFIKTSKKCPEWRERENHSGQLENYFKGLV